MKIFLSHPMTGLTQQEILNLRHTAIVKIKEKYNNATIIDSYLPEFQDTDTPILALSNSLRLLNDADLVVFVTYSNVSYTESKGCQIEELTCNLYGKKKDYLIL